MSGNFHYPGGTVMVSRNCKKCEKVTPHRVNADRKVGDCLECLYKLDPRILSCDELAVMGISENQRKLDVWARQAERDAAPAQFAMF